MNAQTKLEAQSLLGALARALPELESAKKNKANPAFKSKYADLAAVIEAIEPIKDHGLWYRQHSHESADGVKVETFYIHVNGEELSAGSLFMPAAKKDAQGFGSALSYCRRYALQLAFGLATEDDDGNAASNAPARSQSGSGDGQNGGRAASRTGPAPQSQGMPDAEWSKLVQLIEATHTNTGPMLKHYKVESLRDLNQAQYSQAVELLNDRLAEMAAKTNKAAGNQPADIDEDSIPY